MFIPVTSERDAEDVEPLLVDVHSEREFGRLVRYDRLPFGELLAYFRFRRRVLLGVLGPLDETQWARAVREPAKARKESVYWKARSLALHEQEHLKEIDERVNGGQA